MSLVPGSDVKICTQKRNSTANALVYIRDLDVHVHDRGNTVLFKCDRKTVRGHKKKKV